MRSNYQYKVPKAEETSAKALRHALGTRWQAVEIISD